MKLAINKFTENSLVIVVGILIFPQIALAQNITANIGVKSEFNAGELVIFNYTLLSNESATISFMPRIYCPSAPMAPYEVKSLDILKNQAFHDIYVGLGVTDDIISQNCTAGISIINPVSLQVEEEFSINANPKFNLDIFACKDENCTEEAAVFLMSEDIYIKYQSDAKGIVLDASLTHPGGRAQAVSLPMKITNAEAGTYELRIKSTKSGYSPVEKSMQFAVIEKGAEIIAESACNANYVCEVNLGENTQSCPADCPSGGKDDFCDSVKDGICDPDCSVSQDIDCKPASDGAAMDTNLMAGISIVLISFAILGYWKATQKKRVSQILKKLR